jgi:hypothetical protein
LQNTNEIMSYQNERIESILKEDKTVEMKTREVVKILNNTTYQQMKNILMAVSHKFENKKVTY